MTTTMTATLILSFFVVACLHNHQAHEWTVFETTGTVVITVVFTCEAIVKLVALEPMTYFYTGMNTSYLKFLPIPLGTIFFSNKI